MRLDSDCFRFRETRPRGSSANQLRNKEITDNRQRTTRSSSRRSTKPVRVRYLDLVLLVPVVIPLHFGRTLQ